jgi:glycosyltransferase involved in cell wall biosynthesis
MHILCFLPDLDGGGAQRTVVNLANQFAAAGHEVMLAATRTDGPARAWIASGVATVDLGCRHTRAAVIRLAGLIRRERPEILFASMVDANIVAWGARILAGRRYPRLVLRETNSHRARGDLGFLQSRLVGIAYRSADCVVALSEGVRRELVEDCALDSAHTATIHNPVDVEAIGARAAAARREPSPVAGTGPVILGVGRLHRQKHFDLLIRALAALPRKDTQLILLGEGPERLALATLATKHGVGDRVRMPGFVADPVAWLAHADLFVCSSRWEGFGHVIVEAMAAGVPVVSTDCPHGPRDIIVKGETGVLVANDDQTALTSAIAGLLEDPASRERLAGRAAAACRRFAVDRIAQAYLDLFSTILRDH